MGETRKLAAILVADVVGYSRLTGADEDRTLARLRKLRSDLIDPTIVVHHGRVVKRTGDGAIVEFRSAVDAVNFAVEIQRATPPLRRRRYGCRGFRRFSGLACAGWPTSSEQARIGSAMFFNGTGPRSLTHRSSRDLTCR
jgi:class 3 adenylate cyclase